jgi:thioredoxin reductase (NADPH)
MKSPDPVTDLVVIGAGPAGLSCAIEGRKSGLSVRVLEKGSVVDAIRRFPPNMVWFSTPELLEIGGVPFVIPTHRPTRLDTIKYYQRVARHFELDVRPFDAVVGLGPTAAGFRVVTEKGHVHEARFVVVATGYFDHPNFLNVPGEELPHVRHHYDEPFAYFARDVVVVGGRNSAVEAALDLYRNGARVTLIHRGKRLSEGVKYWILPDIENRITAGEITARFCSVVEEIRRDGIMVRGDDGETMIPADAVFVLIGFHPDTAFLGALGVAVAEGTLAPFHRQETLETNVPGLFVAGSVVAGIETNKIFVENGRHHGRVIVDAILVRLGSNP